MSKTTETQQKLKERFGNQYDGSQINYVNARTEVVVLCDKHGPIDILPRDISRRSYICEKCRDEKKSAEKTAAIISKIEAKHPGRFDFSKTHFVNTKTALTVTCKKHNKDAQVYAYDVDRDEYICNECRKEFLHDLFISNTEEFVKKAIAKHGEFYDYSMVNYTSSHDPVKLICPVHGEFEMPARSHLSGRGCEDCGHARTNEAKRGKKKAAIKNKKDD